MKTLTFVAKFDMGVTNVDASSFFKELGKRNNSPSIACNDMDGKPIIITLKPKEFCVKDGKNLRAKRKHNVE